MSHTPFTKVLKEVRKGANDSSTSPDVTFESKSGLPMGFAMAAMGVLTDNHGDLSCMWDLSCMYRGFSLAYYILYHKHTSQAAKKLRAIFDEELTYAEREFILRLTGPNGDTVAHLMAARGILPAQDLIPFGLFLNGEGWSVAHKWALGRQLPNGFVLQKNESWKPMTTPAGETVLMVAYKEGNLPANFTDWTSPLPDGRSLAHFIVDHDYRDHSLSGGKQPTIRTNEFPWGERLHVWYHPNQDGWTVVHEAAACGVLPVDISPEAYNLKDQAGVSVRDLHEEAIAIRRQVRKAKPGEANGGW